MAQPTNDKSLIGAAGVHFVCAELSLRGLIALPTVRNTAGIDIITVNKAGTWVANLQVKSSKHKAKFWIVGKHYVSWCGPNNFYVFVRFLKNERRFEAFLESADQVIAYLTERAALRKKGGRSEWAPCWYLPEDPETLARQWAGFGPPVE